MQETNELATLAGVIGEMVGLMGGLLFIFPLLFFVLPVIVRVLFRISESNDEAVVEKKLPTPGTLLYKLFKKEGESEYPEWLEELIALEKKSEKSGVAEKSIKKKIMELESAFRQEIKSYEDNYTKWKKLNSQALNVSGQGEKENVALKNLGRYLQSQKEVILQMAEQMLKLRRQDDLIQHNKEVKELEKKMQAEQSNLKKAEAIIEEARSIEEKVLLEILESQEASDDMKERAERLLPHFAGVPESEKAIALKRQDFELDLLTLETIVEGTLKLEEQSTK